jgi:hypothetical protein
MSADSRNITWCAPVMQGHRALSCFDPQWPNFNRVKTHDSGSTVAWVVHRNAMAYVVLKKQ